MNNNHDDAQIGRVWREWKEGEAEMSRLLERLRAQAIDLEKVANALHGRCVSQTIDRTHQLHNPLDFSEFALFMDFTHLRQLDGQISTLQQRLARLYEEGRALGLAL